jgi:hypothetical protein
MLRFTFFILKVKAEVPQEWGERSLCANDAHAKWPPSDLFEGELTPSFADYRHHRAAALL